MNEKNYIRKTFVVDKQVIEKLQMIADKEKRSLNWVVKNILLDFCKNGIDKCEKVW